MLDKIIIEDVLFLDIETVPQYADFQSMNETEQDLWTQKAKSLCKDEQNAEDVYQKAGIYAEFGKIVCISVGFAYSIQGNLSFRLKSCYSDDEKELLKEFTDVVYKFVRQHPQINLCAHNGKEFDFPYIARRMLINGLVLPPILEIFGKRPWEVPFIDTMELWRFGDYKNYTSLKLLTHVFGIPSPKDDIDGSQVASVYWQEKDLQRIARYCEKDVLSIAQLLLRYKGMDLISPENVSSSSILYDNNFIR